MKNKIKKKNIIIKKLSIINQSNNINNKSIKFRIQNNNIKIKYFN